MQYNKEDRKSLISKAIKGDESAENVRVLTARIPKSDRKQNANKYRDIMTANPDDRVVAMDIVTVFPQWLQYCGFSDDFDFLCEAISSNFEVGKYLTEQSRKNEKLFLFIYNQGIIKKMVQEDIRRVLRTFDDELRTNNEVIHNAIVCRPDITYHCTPALRTNAELAKRVIMNSKPYKIDKMKHFVKAVLEDRELSLIYAQSDMINMLDIPERYLKDADFIRDLGAECMAKLLKNEVQFILNNPEKRKRYSALQSAIDNVKYSYSVK